MSVVSDTGPLIALAKADQLQLLNDLFDRIHIPPAVHRELLAKHDRGATQLHDALAGFIDVTPATQSPPEVEAATSGLDLGERQAVALAYEREALLVIDDLMGRTAARRLGLSITGAVGVLIRAKEENLIPSVLPLLKTIRKKGYWLSDELLAVAAELAGEA